MAINISVNPFPLDLVNPALVWSATGSDTSEYVGEYLEVIIISAVVSTNSVYMIGAT